MKRVLASLGAIAVGVLFFASPAQATPITYTQSSIASGSLGATTFTNMLVTISLVGDTGGVYEFYPSSGVLANFGTATVNVAGVGTATLNNPNGYFAIFYPPNVFGLPAVGIFQSNAGNTGGTAIFGLFDASLVGYNLQSPLAPVSGAGAGVATNPGGSPVAFSTTAGTLFLTGGGDPVTLSVTVAQVPELSSLSVLALGAFGLIANRLRLRKNS